MEIVFVSEMMSPFFENFGRNFARSGLFDTNQNDEVTFFSYKSCPMMLWCLLVFHLFPGNPRTFGAFALPESAGAPVVEWLTEQDHDFGEIRAGKPVSFPFRFKNISADTLLLQTVRTTCGCTAARYTEGPIAPGMEGEVIIEYDAAQGGSFRKKIRVFFDRQRRAEILWIGGEVN